MSVYIHQIYRSILQKKIGQYGQYVVGKTLDAGSGSYDRYQHLFSSESVVHMDINKSENVDIIGSVDNIPCENEEFDSVVSMQVFEHLEFPEKAAGEIYRVLKPNGYLIVTVPQQNELHEEPHDYWRYTKHGVISLFSRKNFSVVEYSPCGGFFSARAQMTTRYLIDRFNLYGKWYGRIFSKIFKIWDNIAYFLDSFDKSEANRKHTIGWVFVLKKKQ
jgi:SAM-dependent methyltransferase